MISQGQRAVGRSLKASGRRALAPGRRRPRASARGWRRRARCSESIRTSRTSRRARRARGRGARPPGRPAPPQKRAIRSRARRAVHRASRARIAARRARRRAPARARDRSQGPRPALRQPHAAHRIAVVDDERLPGERVVERAFRAIERLERVRLRTSVDEQRIRALSLAARGSFATLGTSCRCWRNRVPTPHPRDTAADGPSQCPPPWCRDAGASIRPKR